MIGELGGVLWARSQEQQSQEQQLSYLSHGKLAHEHRAKRRDGVCFERVGWMSLVAAAEG